MKKTILVFILLLSAIFLNACGLDIGGRVENVVVDKTLSRSDFTYEMETGLTSATVKITPKVNIDWIEMKIEVMNSKDEIIHTETKRHTSLDQNKTYNYKYELSFSALLNAKSYRFVFVEGMKK